MKFPIFNDHVVAEERIEYLSKVLNEGIASASTYELPTNAEEYRPLNDSVIDYGTFEYVIIGGGTTGCVTASRLSEIPGASVLVLEAGELAVDDFLQFPSSVFFSIPSKYNWGFNSVSQTTACLGLIDQKCIAPTGKGMGGTTLINGLLYERGDPTTFDVMAEELDDPSWSYQNVLPLFQKSENFVYNNRWAPVDQDYHGTGGYLNVEHVLPPDELSGAFLDANRYLGYNISDYNGPNLEVATIASFTKNTAEDMIPSGFPKASTPS
ncbi:hypothetical protein JTB14_017780 [Gonioctena quinquepunctata]|nr:hypothetical protein JTB14_017780 [Gonioctena quinquepunctata]